MPYDFNEHKHRYAVWTAARAQRAYATTEIIENAINATDLQAFSKQTELISQEAFDAKHHQWCLSMISYLQAYQAKKMDCTYGRAAKIIAIYLKTAVILPNKGASPICDVIHPPVDRILLANIGKKIDLKAHIKLGWTSFCEEHYHELMKIIRDHHDILGCSFNWRLEENWKASGELIEE